MTDQTRQVNISGRPRTESRVLRRDEEGEAILFDPENGGIHTLNPTGTLIWDLCDGSRTLGEIAGVIQAEFEVDSVQSIQEVLAFAGKMETLGLIRIETGP
jgi:hypothetical protein